VALPEEAMHFAVEIIEQTNPKLFEQMLKDINGEAVYQKINIDYGKNPYYQKDGKPDIRKLKKEAIGKLLVDKVSSIKAQTWWDKIVKFLKELFNKPQMDGVDSLTQFAEMIVSGEDFGTVNDIKSTEDYFQLNEQDKVFNKLKDLDNQITKEDDGVNDDGDPKQSYFIGDLITETKKRKASEASEPAFLKFLTDKSKQTWYSLCPESKEKINLAINESKEVLITESQILNVFEKALAAPQKTKEQILLEHIPSALKVTWEKIDEKYKNEILLQSTLHHGLNTPAKMEAFWESRRLENFLQLKESKTILNENVKVDDNLSTDYINAFMNKLKEYK
jgi:hypothetical protein